MAGKLRLLAVTRAAGFFFFFVDVLRHGGELGVMCEMKIVGMSLCWLLFGIAWCCWNATSVPRAAAGGDTYVLPVPAGRPSWNRWN